MTQRDLAGELRPPPAQRGAARSRGRLRTPGSPGSRGVMRRKGLMSSSCDELADSLLVGTRPELVCVMGDVALGLQEHVVRTVALETAEIVGGAARGGFGADWLLGETKSATMARRPRSDDRRHCQWVHIPLAPSWRSCSTLSKGRFTERAELFGWQTGLVCDSLSGVTPTPAGKNRGIAGR